MRRFLGIATVAGLAAVAVSFAEAAPKREGVTPDLIGDAIAILEFNRDLHQTRPGKPKWTKDGKPRVDAIESLLEADISAADRDHAWDLHRTPVVQAVPVAVDTSQFEARIADLENRAAEYLSANNGLKNQLSTALSRAEVAEGRIFTAETRAAEAKAHYDGLLDGARRNRDAAAKLKAEAANVLLQAEARERGAGPPASRDCGKALQVVFRSGWSWTGNLKTSKANVDAAEKACFDG